MGNILYHALLTSWDTKGTHLVASRDPKPLTNQKWLVANAAFICPVGDSVTSEIRLCFIHVHFGQSNYSTNMILASLIMLIFIKLPSLLNVDDMVKLAKLSIFIRLQSFG